jgi:hypothetical protein
MSKRSISHDVSQPHEVREINSLRNAIHAHDLGNRINNAGIALHTPLNENSFNQHHTLGQMAAQFQESSQNFNFSNNTMNFENNIGADDYDEEEGGHNDDHQQNSASHGTETTGRWTRLEHELFIKALRLYGKVI